MVSKPNKNKKIPIQKEVYNITSAVRQAHMIRPYISLTGKILNYEVKLSPKTNKIIAIGLRIELPKVEYSQYNNIAHVTLMTNGFINYIAKDNN